MRLLNTRTLQLHEVVDHLEVRYAILSHRWGLDEVTFKDLEVGRTKTSGDGYKKLQSACLQARRDHYEFIWVGTCCIDKSSSAELSEAINSMFQWYSNAAVCYAYLSDVSSHHRTDIELADQIGSSSWFTRGWTLQELIAPREVVFFDAAWSLLCRRSTHTDVLSAVTGIDEVVLQGGDFRELSVAKRMSWASMRQTTRLEDKAYSLLGLFDVNMPLLYGEGARAFTRLQQEIMKSSSDHSIFAWGLFSDNRSKRPFPSILADSPAAFANSTHVVSCSPLTQESKEPYEITNQGLRIRLPLKHNPLLPRGRSSRGILNCRLAYSPFTRLALTFCIDSEGMYQRYYDDIGTIPCADYNLYKDQTIWATVHPRRSSSVVNKDRYDDYCASGILKDLDANIRWFWIRSMPSEDQGFQLEATLPCTGWNATNKFLSVPTNSLDQHARAVMRIQSVTGDDLLVSFEVDGSSKDPIIKTHTWHNRAAQKLADLYGHHELLRFEDCRGDVVDGYPGIRARHFIGDFYDAWPDTWPIFWVSFISPICKTGAFRKVDILLDDSSFPPSFSRRWNDAVQRFLEQRAFERTQKRSYDTLSQLLSTRGDHDALRPRLERLQELLRPGNAWLVPTCWQPRRDVLTILGVFVLLWCLTASIYGCG